MSSEIIKKNMQEKREALILEIQEIETVLEETMMPEFIQQILTDAIQKRQTVIDEINQVL